ncbi:MAG: ferredoxin [archaeon]|nr:ferredoxin [archaeon]
MAKPVVDPDLCTGCESCVDICPEVFEMGDDGLSWVKNPNACNNCDCQEAIDNCPVEAISWEA